jgi:2-amino-4-hydroxy-6-hydroxymethyldihydropteridine diphosphokinase
MHERRFVLAPLAEIAPTLLHPTFNHTIADLLANLSA